MSIAAKLWNMLAFGTLGPVDDSGPVQTAQINVGYMETQDARPVVGLFGLATNAPTGCDLVVAYPGGDRSRGVVLGVNHQRSRPRGQAPGETTLFNNFGMTVYCSKDGIVIQSGGKPIVINGDVHVTGAVIAGFGGADQVGLQTHLHIDGTPKPTPGT